MNSSCNYPFEIEFILFNKNLPITQKQKKLRNELIEKLKLILEISMEKFRNYKLLDRSEPTISTQDEKKQLRFSWDTAHLKYDKYIHSLYFHQRHSACIEYFTMDELKEIAESLQKQLGCYLGYDLAPPVISVNTSQI